MARLTCVFAALAVVLIACPVRGQVHTHGDMVGSVEATRVVVWTRASSVADATVVYANNPQLAGALTTPPVRTSPTADFVAKFRLTNLAPGTRYHYRTRLQNPSNSSQVALGPLSSFKTAPSVPAPSTLCVFADINTNSKALYHMFDKVLTHDPDLCLSLGDYPYADGANSVFDFWAKHRSVRDDAKIQRFFRNVGVAATWDDHEVTNDWDAATNATKVANGIAAWKTYFPLWQSPPEIYHKFHWGPDVEIFVLDCRSHRGVNSDPDLTTKSMLGSTQKAWLKNALRASTATFKILCSSVPLRFGTTGTDSWTGYQRERAELLAFVLDNAIQNLIVFSGDQHWGAIHHLREGVREFQFGPIATGTRAPLPFADPERRSVFQQINYGIIRIDPLTAPKTLTVELHGANGLLTAETIRAEPPARVQVTSDAPAGRFVADGPTLFRNSNTAVARARLEPGNYKVSFGEIDGQKNVPSPIDLQIRPGADVRIAARWLDVPDTTHPILHNDSFESPTLGFAIIDEGTTNGPSAWFTDNGYLMQSSNIFGGSTASNDPRKPGTMAITGDSAWTDYTVSVRVRSKDDDAVGVIFRYRDPRNYYRFAWRLQDNYRRLTKTENGVVTILDQRSPGFVRHRFHDVRITAVGPSLTVYVDGAKELSATDATHTNGKVGLYTWANFLTEFDDLVVRAGEVRPSQNSPFPTALFYDDFGDGRLSGWTISDQGTISAPSNWSEANGVLSQLSNIYGGSLDGRLLPKPGTMATVQAALPDDLYLSVAMANADNDGMGVVFRYLDDKNHYRFSWDAQRAYRRLTKVVGGTWTTLHEDPTPYALNQTYRVATQVEGNRIRIYIDGALWVDRTDNSHKTGTVGLYCWGSQGLIFDDALVMRPLLDPSKAPTSAGNKVPRPVLTAQLRRSTQPVTEIVGRHLPARGHRYVLALAFSPTPGIPLAWANPADPRHIELAPDSLFLWSLRQSPILGMFQGTLDQDGYLRAQLDWPRLPGTTGSIIYCAGWITDPASGQITEVLPTVEIVFP